MKKTCNDCGREFTAVKTFYTVCFDCHLERIRQAQRDRAALFVPRVRDLTSKRFTSNTYPGGKPDAMQEQN